MTEFSERSEQKLSTQEAIAKALDLEQRLDEQMQVIKPALHDHQDELHGVIAEIEKGTGPLTHQQELDITFAYLKATLAPDELAKIGPTFGEVTKTIAEQTRLETMYGEKAQAEFATAYHASEHTTDWGGIITRITANDEEAKDWEYRVVNMASVSQPSTLIDCGESFTILSSFQADVDQADLRLTAPTPEPKNTWEQLQLSRDLKALWDETEVTSSTYLSPTREAWYHAHKPQKEIVILTSLLRSLNNTSIRLSNDALDAIAKVGNGLINDAIDKEFEHNNADRQTGANLLLVDAYAGPKDDRKNLFKEATGLDDAPGWVNERLARFPARFSQGLGFVIFKEDLDDDDKPATSKKVTTGIMGHDNTLYLSTKNAKRMQPQDAKENMERTFDHELGHYIHNNVLSLKELGYWHRALLVDPLPVDDYTEDLVQDATQAHGAVEQKRHSRALGAEQFASTLDAYMNRHLLLAVRFPDRFAWLNRLAGKYDQEGLVAEFEALKQEAAALKNAIPSATPQSDSTETP